MDNNGVVRNRAADRPEMKTKAQVKKWVDTQSPIGKEFPWSEECWNEAEVIAKQVQKEKQEKNELGAEFYKGKLVNKKGSRFYSVDPVTNYFKLRSSGKYNTERYENKKKKEQEIKEDFGIAVISNNKVTDSEDLSTREKDSLWFEEWISSFVIKEQQYLRSRFRAYTDDYEITTASDQAILMQILAVEISLYRMNQDLSDQKFRASSQQVKDRDLLSTQLKNLLSEQQWTKKSQGKKLADESSFTSWMNKLMIEGYTVPDIVVDSDEVDLILKDIRDQIEDMYS